MKCPNCKSTNVVTKEIEPHLTASHCNQCGGLWIKASNYWRWLQQHGRLPEIQPATSVTVPTCDSTKIKICPDCGHFLTRKKVGHGLSFQVDRCGACGGIWLDKDEWETLKSRNLHDEIHFIFSEPWQKEIMQQEQKESHEAHAKKLLGPDGFAKVSDFKTWMAAHPQHEFIMAILMHE